MAVIRLRLWKVDRPTEADFPNPVNFLERLLGGAAAINGCQGWVASRASRGPTAVPVPAARGPSPRPPWADGDARRAEAPASGNSSARPLHRDADARPLCLHARGASARMAEVGWRGARIARQEVFRKVISRDMISLVILCQQPSPCTMEGHGDHPTASRTPRLLRTGNSVAHDGLVMHGLVAC